MAETKSKSTFEITGSALKWIAIVLMFLNHFCIGIHLHFGTTDYFTTTAHWYLTRAAFLIFAFLISEGMHYTHDRKKYIFSLFAFAIISEIPFDLIRTNMVYDFSAQNVFFTLGLGALAIVGIDYFKGKPIFQIISVFIASVIAVYLNTDYDFLGVVVITSFYAFRDVKWKQLLFTAIIFLIITYLSYLHDYSLQFIESGNFTQLFISKEVINRTLREYHGLLAFPFLALYKGNKGKNINKWFFYGFYPGHLFLIWLFTIIVLALR